MAEQAAGAVSSLLGIIRSEAQLLSGIGDDMRSIKEEMESMNSFLEFLARTVPPDRDHDEQVRTWMNQVRHLALDCNSCLDLYLYRSSPEILLSRGRFGRYLCWLPWFLRKMVAQHSVANQLRQLKDRAREVSERRSRYTVEVSAVARMAAGQSPPVAGLNALTMTLVATSGGDDDEDEDGDADQVVAVSTDKSDQRGSLFECRALEDHLNTKLDVLMNKAWRANTRSAGSSIPSVAVVAPDTEDTSIIASEVSAAAAIHFELTVLVDIPAVHSDNQPLRPKDILFYILWGLKRAMSSRSQQQGRGDNGEIIIITEEEMEEDHVGHTWKEYIYMRKMEEVGYIKEYIETKMKLIDDKEINEMIIKGINQITCQVKLSHLRLEQMLDDELECKSTREDLMLLLLLLYRSAAAAEQRNTNQKLMPRSAEWYKKIINITARRLKDHIEAYKRLEEAPLRIRLNEAQYADILQEVLPWTHSSKHLQDQDTNSQATTTTKGTSTTSMGEDQIRKIVHKILQEMQEDIPVKKLSTLGDPIMSTDREKNEDIQGTTSKETMKKTEKNEEIPDTTIKEQIMKKIEEIKHKVKKQLKIKGIVDQIQNHLHNRSTLIILKIDQNCISRWEETQKALSMLGHDMRAVIVTRANNTQRAEEYCYPPQKTIDYSLVGLYHDSLLELTTKHKNDDIYLSPQMIRDILVQCEPHEFCMKIFAHAMYSKPKRSNDQLRELLNTLMAVSPKSLGNIAKKMLQFSFSDLSKEYKSCLLYLAIFPQGYTIRRSTLIGRWVAEGLINREDWHTSVGQAERCFEAVVDRWLVYPASIGATGKVKSCTVGELVHKFINKIARKQGILEKNLSDHLAHHFSIFNDIQLRRRSDRIEDFLQMLSKSPQLLSPLKVLDLQGCHCFGMNDHLYLKYICRKILLLKYLSLRKTNLTYLPFEINNLRELEVLDIRQTEIPPSSTKDLCLLKLKRLLAGNIMDHYSSRTISVAVPRKIEKMDGMEVLSNVKPGCSELLISIGKLWHLRKLGVVIKCKKTHLEALIQVINNLHECIQSLSITLDHSNRVALLDEPINIHSNNHYILEYRPPKFLKSLKISGATNNVCLLESLLGNESQLTKITIRNSTLSQGNLKVLSKLPMLLCVKLQRNAYVDNMITFKKGEFKNLKYFLIEGSEMTEIIFDDGATELEKMVLSLSDDLNLSGLDKLQRLEELELNKNNIESTTSNNNMLRSLFDNAKRITKVTLHGTMLKHDGLQILAKKPNIRCLVLLHMSYDESQLIFDKEDFPKLNLLTVECSNIKKISFAAGSCPKLEKFIWTFTDMEHLIGIGSLQRLKEVEFNGEFVRDVVKEEIKKHINEPFFIHYKPEKKTTNYKEA